MELFHNVMQNLGAINARDKLSEPTRGNHELTQIDFTWFKVVDWARRTIGDDYSRCILSRRLCKGMGGEEVMQMLA
jgi:hypothetical protein